VPNATESPGIVHFDGQGDVQPILNVSHGRGYKHVDTASNYSSSEAHLGEARVAIRFSILKKVYGFSKIQSSIAKSLEEFRTLTVETMFLHVHDRQTQFEDTAKVMNDAFQHGKLKSFGLSNFAAAEVESFIEICEERGYIKPSVFKDTVTRS
jgi:aflatoxin B1 aldehyde reductase